MEGKKGDKYGRSRFVMGAERGTTVPVRAMTFLFMNLGRGVVVLVIVWEKTRDESKGGKMGEVGKGIRLTCSNRDICCLLRGGR
jgi:hypothetical protein